MDIQSWEQYTVLATRTAKPGDENDNLTHYYLGLVDEAGEIAKAAKADMVYNKPLDEVNMLEELGDMAWYISQALRCSDGDPQDMLIQQFTAHSPAELEDYQELALTLARSVGRAMDRRNHSLTGLGVAEDMARILRDVDSIRHRIGKTWPDIWEANIRKLMKRYPDGFSEEHAQDRNHESERAALEGATLSEDVTSSA